MWIPKVNLKVKTRAAEAECQKFSAQVRFVQNPIREKRVGFFLRMG